MKPNTYPTPSDMSGLFRKLVLSVLFCCCTSVSFAEERLTMNMRDADIRALIQWIADNTGKNIIVHKAVEGSVTVLSNQPVTRDEAYQVFLSVLQTHGYAAIETDNALKVIPANLATQQGLPLGGRSSSSDMVVKVFRVQNTSAAQLAETLKPMISKDARLIAYPETNSLIAADHRSNIENLERLLGQLDKSGDSDIQMVSLKHADANDVVKALNALLPKSGNDPHSLKISVDERSNSILMTGDPARRKNLVRLIAQLDTPLQGGGNTQVIYLHYVDAEEIAPILQSMAKSIQQERKDDESPVTVEPAKSANALVINAPPSVLNSMSKVVEQLDIRRAQVMIEALVVEVRGDVAKDLGVTWITSTAEDLRGSDTFGAVNTLGNLSVGTPVTDSNGNVSGFLPGRGLTYGYFEDGNLQAALRALNATTKANILSTPTVVTVDNEEASLLVGQNVPFKTGQSTGVASSTSDPFTTIERQDIGISLVVTPRINQGDSITLELEQSVENVAPSVESASDLITNKRQISTKVLIKDDQILVIGGLISDDEQETRDKVPLLGDIPLLGKLFSSTSKSREKNNLMVFIHPVILKDDDHIEELSRKRYDFMRALQTESSENRIIEGSPSPVLEEFETFSPINR